MNRNTMYHYLKSKKMYPIQVWHESRKKYYTKYVLNRDENQAYCEIITDWGYIRDIHSIYLCRDEIVAESKLSDMRVNIKYRSMNKFEVNVFSESEIN